MKRSHQKGATGIGLIFISSSKKSHPLKSQTRAWLITTCFQLQFPCKFIQFLSGTLALIFRGALDAKSTQQAASSSLCIFKPGNVHNWSDSLAPQRVFLALLRDKTLWSRGSPWLAGDGRFWAHYPLLQWKAVSCQTTHSPHVPELCLLQGKVSVSQWTTAERTDLSWIWNFNAGTSEVLVLANLTAPSAVVCECSDFLKGRWAPDCIQKLCPELITTNLDHQEGWNPSVCCPDLCLNDVSDECWGRERLQQVCRWHKTGRNGWWTQMDVLPSMGTSTARRNGLAGATKISTRSSTSCPSGATAPRTRKCWGPNSWQKAWQKSFPGFPISWLGCPASVPGRGADGTCLPAALTA